VYSEPEKGTTFKLYFNKTSQPEGRPLTRKPKKELGGTETILVVDDEVSIGHLLADMLQPLGYRTLTATSSEEALRISSQEKETIDILLTDVIMQGMNGMELFKEVKKGHPETKVIFMSGYTDTAIAHHGVLDPGLTFLSKPLMLNDVITMIRRALDQ